MTLRLAARDTALLNGDEGAAAAFAMEVLTAFARAVGAPVLLDISQAHIDGCPYHGQVSLDFVERLVETGAACACPPRSCRRPRSDPP